MKRYSALAQLYLRLALGTGFTVLALDRVGVWGHYGDTYVSWGDWHHFSAYAHQVMGFLPYSIAEVLAVLASVAELVFGVLLLTGFHTRKAAMGSALLTFCFSVSMAISFGITSPINYSVFTVSAASFLLAGIPEYKWSIDQFLLKHRLQHESIQPVRTTA
ncbi:DoxX family protein [Deminuibacter soli]|nr:DoxX family protein [Deminuibacter soli]